MKHWGSALFPLSVLLTLAALTFWLRYATELPEERHDGKHRHDPDYIVSGAVLRKLDANGLLKYTLKAADIRHYPDDDSTDMREPHIVFLHPTRPPITVSAARGHANADGEQVDFYDNVRVERGPTKKDEALIATMPQLTVLPDDDRAYTKSPVLITQGKSWIKGVGMQVDSRAQTYLLESQATALLESKHAKRP